ncbi:hypothetical protein LB467_13940 [Salegentibacter sp. JZCK2]|uniref:hypothetical protein n=1 Tax=Salegentibacter tibetensis TaxID=2873600 RepID=UPI001CCA69C6|nr:hypothetical protein [Salegentibacter tibetensis]MBZ9730792.1 hypothetical protein [Salegentibacter tibetensis]
MKKLFSKLLAITLVVGLYACSSDDSTKQPVLSINFNTVTSPFEANAQASSFNKQTSGGNFVFSDGFITISELEYEAETENDSTSVEFELEGIVMIDFATGIPTPDIRAIAIPAGTYEEVEIEVELSDETDEPGVVLNGIYTSPDGTTHPVRFEFNSDEEFEVEREGTIVFTENQSAIAEITFDPSVWFAGVSDEHMESANKNMDGIIVISEEHNSDIFDIVADGLDLATDLEIEN